MKKKKANKLNIPIWPIIHIGTIFDLIKVYLSKNWSWWGNYERKFIREFLKIHPAKYATTTTSGTMALESCFLACGIEQGDEVIVPAYTWLSTALPIAKIGAKPVIVDIDYNTLCISPKKIEEAITDKTKAIIPVHLYSAMADMNEIIDIANKYNLIIIEDAAHAHGAQYRNKAAGTIGHAGAFSFQQSKLLTSGEGGICTTDSHKIAVKLDKINHIGCSIFSKTNTKQTEIPYNKYVFTEFQAAILFNQCKYLIKNTLKRQKNALLLENFLKDVDGIRFQQTAEGTTRRSYYNFVIIVNSNKFKPKKNIDNIIEDLNEEGIHAQKGYGNTIDKHILWNITESNYIKKETPIADKISEEELICLPHTILLADKKTIKKIASIIKRIIAQHTE